MRVRKREGQTEREAERRSRTNSPTEKRRNQRKPSSAEHKSSSSLPRAMSFLFSSEIRLLSGNPQYNSSHRAMQDLIYPFKCIVSSWVGREVGREVKALSWKKTKLRTAVFESLLRHIFLVSYDGFWVISPLQVRQHAVSHNVTQKRETIIIITIIMIN